jgi:large subunit ribosomal protein L27Ae
MVLCLQVGMRHFHKTKNQFHCPIVNLDKIWSLVGEEVSLVQDPPDLRQ